jgi:hypothetical protein
VAIIDLLGPIAIRLAGGINKLDELDENDDIAGMRNAIIKNGTVDSGKPAQWTMRDARTGAFVTVTEPPGKPLPETKQIGRAMALSTGSVSVVLKALRAATSKSKSVGKPLQFTVEVEPNGAPRIVTGSGPEREAEKAQEEADADLETALEAARGRGRNRVAEILASDDMLSAQDFADHLKTTRATINARRQARQVLGLQGATRGYRYPVWQIGEDGRPFSALPAIFEALGRSPWAVYRFLVQKHGELDGLSGREALRRGQDDAAVKAAESVARAFA